MVSNKGAIASGVGALVASGALQFFTVTYPEMQRAEHEAELAVAEAVRADANRDRIFTASDALRECNIERRGLLERLIGEP